MAGRIGTVRYRELEPVGFYTSDYTWYEYSTRTIRKRYGMSFPDVPTVFITGD